MKEGTFKKILQSQYMGNGKNLELTLDNMMYRVSVVSKKEVKQVGAFIWISDALAEFYNYFKENFEEDFNPSYEEVI